MTWDRRQFLARVGAACGLALTGAPLRAEQPRGERPVAPVDGEEFWAAVRAQYQFHPGLTYFNTGGLGPAALLVQSATESAARELQRLVETGHSRFDQVRAPLARFFGARPEELAFVRNATEANGLIAAGLGLRRGDEVIFESHAHPGGSFPWLRLQQEGVRVRLFEPDPTNIAANVERVAELLTPRTRAVQVSHVTAPTGLVLPVSELARLCRRQGVWFHIDGAQAMGMLPFRLNQLDCDSYAISGHKWLGGPHETGVLYVRQDRLAAVTPVIVGAHSADLAELPGDLELRATAARFEYGTRNVAPVVGLAAAAEWQSQVGRERIAARGRFLVDRLRAGLGTIEDIEILTPASSESSASMLTFRSPRLRHEVLFNRLFAEHRLRCRPVSELGLDAVRVSCHLFNTPSEVDRLVAAVDHVVRTT
jgi:selenocysteine lyase/cysteine desulfurase